MINYRVFDLAAIVVATMILFLIAPVSLQAAKHSGPRFVGLYYLCSSDSFGGDQRLLEIGRDGTLSGFVSTQIAISFDGQKGAWERSGNRTIVGTILNFFDEDGGDFEPAVLTRGEFEMTCEDNQCNTVTGNINLYFGDIPGNDPDLMQTFSGQRVRALTAAGELHCQDSSH